jgi:Icc-related predicted phosphoesterase
MSKFKEFLQKAGKVVPDVLEVGGNIIGGNYIGAIKNVGELLKGESEKNEEAKELLQEFELKKLEFEQELKKLYLDDKKDARSLYKVDSSLQKVFAITFLSLYIVLSFVVLCGLYLISIQGLKLDNYVVSFVSTLHGGMSMKVGTIVDFLFGSSQQ